MVSSVVHLASQGYKGRIDAVSVGVRWPPVNWEDGVLEYMRE